MNKFDDNYKKRILTALSNKKPDKLKMEDFNGTMHVINS